MFKTMEITMKTKSNALTLAVIAIIGLGFTSISWSHGEEKHPDSSPFFVNRGFVPIPSKSALRI
jgi:hypothetical protein